MPFMALIHIHVEKVGENANAILETKKYDDGTVKCNITNLE